MIAVVEDLADRALRNELCAALEQYFLALEFRLDVLEEVARLDGHDLADYAPLHQ
jgi:hypothetical protein